MAALKIEEVPLSKLRENPRNTRTHPSAQIRRIAESIRHFGFTSPIIADHEYCILAGHARRAGAKALGLRTVPVVVLPELTEAERRVFLLADNKIGEMAGWDRSALAVEWSELSPLLTQAGLDVELTGFEVGEIDSLLGDFIDPEQDPPEQLIAVENEAVTSRGDLWCLSEHRLLCGDTRDEADLRAVMGRRRADMIFADPPYNVRVRSTLGRGKIKHREFVAASGEMSQKQYSRFLATALGMVAKYSADGSIHFICTDWRHLREMLDAGEEVYSELKNVIVWTKTNVGQGSFYRSQHELIFVWKNGHAQHRNNFGLGQHGRTRSNVWTYPGVNTFRSGRLEDLAAHPTTKPVKLVADAIRDCSKRGDIILDPFMGSGTTIVAAESIGRRAYGFDLDPLYVDVSVRRWQALTKRDALLHGTRKTFDEVAADRRTAKSKAGA